MRKSVTNNIPQLKTKIHELRKEHNMKQEELAKLVGVRRL
ncbi:helix-turn-helix domain-containing protein [Clostridium botulinum]